MASAVTPVAPVASNCACPSPSRQTSSPQGNNESNKPNLDDLLVKWYFESEGNSKSEPSAVPDAGKAPVTLDDKIDRMLELYAGLNQRVTQDSSITRQCLKEIHDVHNRLVQKVVDYKAELVDSQIRMSDLENRVIQAEKSVASYKEQVTDLRRMVLMMNTKMENTEKTLLNHSTEIKERKLILAGVPESKGEKVCVTALTKLQNILQLAKELQDQPGYKGTKLNVSQNDINAQSLDMVYRIGKFRKGSDRPRNIMVSLVKYADRQKIMRAKALLKADSLDYYVNEDLSIENKVHRATMKQLVKSAKEVDYEAKISGNKLIIEGETYESNDFDIIPGCILRNCRQEKHFEEGIAYKGERSVYSNFFFKPFILDGKKYTSVEQHFQFTKAKYFGYHSIARKIMRTANPFDNKSLGRRVEKTLTQSEIDEWNEQAYDHLYDANYAKFSQNRSLCLDLLGTQDRQLLEATTDPTYGCGIELSSNKWEDGSWNGENMAGRVVMDVRNQLREEGFEEALCSLPHIVSSEYTQTTPCSPPISTSNHRSLAGGTSSSEYVDPRHRPNAAARYRGFVTNRSEARRSNIPHDSLEQVDPESCDNGHTDTSYHSQLDEVSLNDGTGIMDTVSGSAEITADSAETITKRTSSDHVESPTTTVASLEKATQRKMD